MKQIFSLIFLFLSLGGYSQITIRGVKNDNVIFIKKKDKNADSKELKFDKNTYKDVKTDEEVAAEKKMVDDSTRTIKTSETISFMLKKDSIERRGNIQEMFGNDDDIGIETDIEEENIKTFEFENTAKEVEDIETNEDKLNNSEGLFEKEETITEKEIEIEQNIDKKGIIEIKELEEKSTVKTNKVEDTNNESILIPIEKTKSKETERLILEEKEKPRYSFYNKNKTENNVQKTKEEQNFSSEIKEENKQIEIQTVKEEISSETSNPKNGSWSVGLGVGLPIIVGDMDTRYGYGLNLHVQKAIGHVFSLRFQAIALETFGQDYKRNFYNYKTRFTDYSLQGIFTLNNLNFYKKEPKVIYNLIVGGGMATTHSWSDFKDGNNLAYDFSSIPTGSKKEILDALDKLYDKSYETVLAKDNDVLSIGNTNIHPTAVVGIGVSFKLSKAFDLNLESRMSYHFTDVLDGYKLGATKDWMSYTSLGLSFKFPSKTESMLWTNPVYSKIEEIEELKKKVDEGDLLKDEDKDGIADIFDQDLNTPAKVAVDSRGVASDLDKDGVPDYLDKEPFTPMGAQVDVQGIAIDSDNDGIADVLDQETNTIAGSQVDARGKTIVNNKKSLADIQSNSDFELILFDDNSYRIKKEFYSDLYKITRFVNANPTAVIEIIGHTDVLASEKYNLQLSEKRANAVYRMLIELFRVPSQNLKTLFLGESAPIIEGLPEEKDSKMAPAYYLNRRVEFKIVE